MATSVEVTFVGDNRILPAARARVQSEEAWYRNLRAFKVTIEPQLPASAFHLPPPPRVSRRGGGLFTPGGHIHVMGHVDTCLGTLRRLIAAGDMNGVPRAEAAIEEYWAATPVKARKSGLLYIQQILHDRRDALGPQSRDFARIADAYIEKKLTT